MSDSIHRYAIADYDVADILKLASVGLEEDAPLEPKMYLNSVLNILYGYVNDQALKDEVRDYISEKKYITTPKIEIATS
jgi:hypothetical protein